MEDEAPTDPMASRLLSREEAAAYLGGIPLGTLDNLVRTRRIGHVKVTRGVVAFSTTQLDEYIAAHTVAVVENPWGLSDASLRSIREGRSGGRGRTF